MIYFLCTSRHQYTVTEYLGSWGKELAARLQVVPYSALAERNALPSGTYIFGDLERLNATQTSLVSEVWNRLARAGIATRLLNHPTRSLRRRALLDRLAESGVNQFRAFPVDQPGEPWRYPVFVREENAHTGALTPLLENRSAVQRAVLAARLDGLDPKNLLVVEFCPTADANGIYRKYSAFRVGDRIIPRHIIFSRKWMLKDVDLLDPPFRAEGRQYVATNPHEKQIRECFDLAALQYGRIDYSLKDGAMQVWEINTNAVVMRPQSSYPVESHDFHQRFADAFADAIRAIDTVPSASGLTIPMDWTPHLQAAR